MVTEQREQQQQQQQQQRQQQQQQRRDRRRGFCCQLLGQRPDWTQYLRSERARLLVSWDWPVSWPPLSQVLLIHQRETPQWSRTTLALPPASNDHPLIFEGSEDIPVGQKALGRAPWNGVERSIAACGRNLVPLFPETQSRWAQPRV